MNTIRTLAAPAGIQRRSGVALVAAGLLLNPWLIGWLLAPDGTVDGERRIALIALFQAFCILSGIACLWTQPRVALRSYIRTPLAAAASILFVSASIVAIGWGLVAYNNAHHHTVDVGGQAEPTPAQRQWAQAFVQQSLESARRHGWFEFEQAQREGFQRLADDPAHYFKREFLFDDRVLDPERPEFLMYRDTPRGKLLVGFMYFARSVDERGPQPGGVLTSWHYHPWGLPGYCAEGGILPIGRPDEEGGCPDGVHVTRSAEMLHVWFIDHPLGPYAHAMIFPAEASPLTMTTLHPIAVHFGIALLLVGVGLDLAGKVTGRTKLHSAAGINLLIGAAAIVATVAAGMAAEVQLLITQDVHQVLDRHKLLGFSVLGGTLLLGGWRLAYRGAFPARGGPAYLALGLLTAGLCLGAGYYGSELVYVHGVAVQAVDRTALERYERSVSDRTLTAPVVTTSGAHAH